ILDTPQESDFDELVRLAAQICQTPIALVSLVDQDRQWFKGRYGLELSETPRRLSFCAHSILQAPAMMEVPNALQDKRFADNELVTGPLGIRFYAAAPLVSREGQALGTLCVIDTRPRQLNAEQKEALRVLGRQVMVQLELRRSVAELGQAAKGLAAAHLEQCHEQQTLVSKQTAELARANAASRQKEERFQTLAEATFEGIVFHQLGRIVDCNEQFAAILGRRRQELSGRDLREFLPPEEHELALRAAREHRDSTLDVHLRRQDGSWRVVEVHGRELGEAGVRVATVRDVTERKRGEEALRAIVRATAGSGEEFFRGLVAELAKVLGVKYALVGVLVAGAPERVRTVAMWCRGDWVENCVYTLAGSPCANVVGKQLCHYPSEVQRLFPRDPMLAEAGVVSYLGIPLYSSAGAALGVLCVMDEQPMPNSELAVSLMTIFAARAAAEVERQEALEGLKASEAKYRQLHKGMRDAFAAVDLSGRLTDYNETFRQMLGYEAAELTGLRHEEFTPAKWHAFEAAILQSQVMSRGYSDIYEKEYRRRDGTVFPVELRVVLLRDDAGTPYGMWAIVRDISERKQAEERLRQSREELRQRAEELETIMGSAPVALWVAHDPQCNNIVGNRMAGGFDEASPQINWSANVPSGFQWFQEGHPLQPEALPMQQAARKNIEIHNTELELLLPSGKCISLLGSAVPLRDRQGGVRGCVGAFLDITERKQAQEALRRSEEQMRLFLRSAPASIAVFDREMHYLAVSHRWMQDYGLTGEVIGQCHYELFPEVPERWKEVHRRALAGETLKAEADRFERADGRVQWIKWEVLPWHRAGGEVGGIMIVSEEITRAKQAEEALRHSEERFRTMADAMPQLAWIARPDGHVVWYNRRWYEYTGTRPEQLEGWNWQSVHDPQMLPRVLQRWGQSLATGEPFEMEFPLRGADGVFHPFLTRMMPLKNASGQVVWWFGTSTDIREIVAARETLARSREDLERLVRERTAQLAEANANLQNFAYTAAHDLRSPLRGINSFASIALARYGERLDEMGRSMLERVVDSADQMGRLLTDLLEYSKMAQKD
ncbi:MAG TPA: PAS domain S-box protein, partial [Candidatus Sulfotelmatobacter sp.]|nr:PAS domain S-box protein [Candidatus Sulfotelmatobacter sp.]